MDPLIAALVITGAYLWGAVPSSYLVGRYRKGIDIRRYGSGNVGATNLMAHVGKRTGFMVGVFDCLAKGTLPVVIARILDTGDAVQAAAGLAAIVGHSWSPYIRFTGGRGVATAIGVLFGSLMWPEMLILTVVLGGIGRLAFHDTGFWTFISLLALPLLAFIFDRPPETLTMALGIGVLLLAKRLTANWERPDSRYPVMRVLAFRALWDRDVPRKLQWTDRRPTGEGGLPDDVGNPVLR
jgi:glycerol-3-phosphate acyltransferase PlsY